MKGTFTIKQTVSGLMARRLSKIIRNDAENEMEKRERVAMEEYVERLKNKGVRKLEGNSYTLIIK